MAGAVLNALNTRLDADTMAFMLNHGQARALLVDREFSEVAAQALKQVDHHVLVIDVNDALYTGAGQPIGESDYETLLAGGDPDVPWEAPADGWDAICMHYTLGLTGHPQRVLYHHSSASNHPIRKHLEYDTTTPEGYLDP